MANSRPDGNCPYCASHNSDPVTDAKRRRPDQEVRKCESCLKYFVLSDRGSSHPMDDPTDKNSYPAMRTRD